MTSSKDPYHHASYISKLKENKTIVLTDLDDTFATRAGPLKEIGDRAAVRALLDTHGFVAGAVTARTPALTMSSTVYRDSCKLGFTEAEPHCGFDASLKRIYVPLEELPFFAHSLDWDIVAGLGSGVYPRNGRGYLIDREFDLLLNYDHVRGESVERYNEPLEASYRYFEPPREPKDRPLPWRQAALALLMHMPWAAEYFSPLESGKNYHDGVTDVMPLPYRIQMQFRGAQGLARMREFKELLWLQAYHHNNPVAMRTVLVDESKPSNNSEQSIYTLYLLPWAGRKEKMINHLFSRSAAAAGVPAEELRLFYAGDTPTDLKAGLWAGGAAPLTFLLATGSRLAPYLIERQSHFGDEPLDFLWESGTLPGRLTATEEKGVYTFKAGGRRWRNTVVIGDERYPGTTPPGSVLAFLEEFAIRNAGL